MNKKFLKKINRIKKKLRLKRLKIAEQILIVLFIAVLIPMIISSIVINNINQQAMRRQLKESAILVANVVSDELDVFFDTANNELDQIEMTLSLLPSNEAKNAYINKLKTKSSNYENLELVASEAQLKKIYEDNATIDRFTLNKKTTDGKYIVATFIKSDLNKYLFKSFSDDARQVYIVDSKGNMIASHNYTEDMFNQSINLLPKEIEKDTATVYGDVKNQPIVYISKSTPNTMIIVNTTQEITQSTINDNRFKLLMAVFVSSLSIFILVALYIYYMYINIRQLFKGIISVSKGNYERRIRLLKSIFTPYEIVFLTSEFNKMASDIHKSYLKLKKQNKELKQLNEFRSNLIDTVSHELRTPLTSIQGYTSRLLRTDIEIDEETRVKSLLTIKRQSERLKRLIEDLLIIPDIERERIRVTLEPVWFVETVENSITLVKNNAGKEIVNEISEDFPLVTADKDRAEQIMVNLIENAIKYSNDDSKITIQGNYDEKYATISILNDCEKIPNEKLNSLFEKFIRMDDKTTRVTRGTGLGLFIVKGLVEAMNGKIQISSTDEIGFKVEIKFPLIKSDEA